MYNIIMSLYVTLMQAAIGNVFSDVLVHQIVKELFGFSSGTCRSGGVAEPLCVHGLLAASSIFLTNSGEG